MKPSRYKDQSSPAATKYLQTAPYGADAISPAWVRLEPMKWLLTRDVDDEALPGLQSTRLWLDLGGRIFRTTLGLHLQCNASARSRAEPASPIVANPAPINLAACNNIYFL